MKALGAIGDTSPPTIEALIVAIRTGDWQARREAPAIPALIENLGDPDSTLRSWVAWALTRMGRAAIPALTAALDAGDPVARRNAAGVLVWLGEGEGRPIAIVGQALRLEDEDVRLWAERIVARHALCRATRRLTGR